MTTTHRLTAYAGRLGIDVYRLGDDGAVLERVDSITCDLEDDGSVWGVDCAYASEVLEAWGYRAVSGWDCGVAYVNAHGEPAGLGGSPSWV